MRKRILYTEAAWLLGVVLLALGTALMERGGYGISIVVAPAYVLHLAVEGLSFGMAEYVLQALILAAVLGVMGRLRLVWFLSFATALFYGAVLDGFLSFVPAVSAWLPRLGVYAAGVLLCAVSISLMFHTYLPPAVYELFVGKVSGKLGVPLYRFKTVYDCVSCLAAAGMSLAFFGMLRGVGPGSVVCAMLNGVLIRFFSAILEKRFDFRDGLSLRAYFTEKEVSL